MSQCLLVAACEAQCEAVKPLYNRRIGRRLPAAWLTGYFISGSARYALGVVYAAAVRPPLRTYKEHTQHRKGVDELHIAPCEHNREGYVPVLDYPWQIAEKD